MAYWTVKFPPFTCFSAIVCIFCAKNKREALLNFKTCTAILLLCAEDKIAVLKIGNNSPLNCIDFTFLSCFFRINPRSWKDLLN